jgi:hypothetical protein
MNMWRVGEDMGSKETDGCPLTDPQHQDAHHHQRTGRVEKGAHHSIEIWTRDYHGWIRMDPDKYPWMVDKFLWIWIYPWIIHIIHKTDK